MSTEFPPPLRIEACPTGTGSAALVAIEPVNGRLSDHPAPLSAFERRRAAAMAPHRRAEFVRGRLLLRRLAARMLDIAPAQVPLVVAPGGALRLRGWPVGVSLSHCLHWTVAAVYDGGDVGVDVQEAPAVLDERLVRRCLGTEATAALALPGPSRAAAFARVWAVQEACVKAVGLGLSAAPWRIPVALHDTHGRWGEVSWRVLDAIRPVALAVATRPRVARQTALEER